MYVHTLKMSPAIAKYWFFVLSVVRNKSTQQDLNAMHTKFWIHMNTDNCKHSQHHRVCFL